MQKTFPLLVICLSLSFFIGGACKKNKPDRPVDPDGKVIYLAGSLENSAGTSLPTIWKNGVPQSLSTNEGSAYDIFLSGSDEYVTGYELVSNDRVAKVWKNGVPQTLPASTNYASGEQIFVSDGKVYVLGFETFSYQTALWIDGVKQSMALPAHPYNSGNQNVGLTVLNGDVYTAGVIKNAAGVEKAALLKNGGRMGIDTLPNTSSSASRLTVAGNDIYMTGYEAINSSNPIPLRLWKNGVKQTLADAPAGANFAACFVSGSDVYLVGEDRSKPVGTIGMLIWKNGRLIHEVGGNNRILNPVAIVVSDGDVYVGGSELVVATGIWKAKIWVNGIEQAISDGIKAVEISAMAIKK